MEEHDSTDQPLRKRRRTKNLEYEEKYANVQHFLKKSIELSI